MRWTPRREPSWATRFGFPVFRLKPPKKIDAQALKHVAPGMILVPMPFLCKRRPSLSPSKWAPPGESRVTVTAASPRRLSICSSIASSRLKSCWRNLPAIWIVTEGGSCFSSTRISPASVRVIDKAKKTAAVQSLLRLRDSRAYTVRWKFIRNPEHFKGSFRRAGAALSCFASPKTCLQIPAVALHFSEGISRRPDAMCAAQGASRGMELQRASPPI